jgi:glycosyltransferase involved in cell wall biosynthesis
MQHAVIRSSAPAGPAIVQDAPTIWLSILSPVYNVESFIGECLESIASEMMEGVEVLLLDDRSTDRSKDLCERFRSVAGGAFRIIVHSENKGVGAARNRLLTEAAGRYVWFVDPDDRILPGAVRRLRDVTSEFAPDVVLCDYLWKNRRRSSFAGRPNLLLHDRADLVRGVFANRRLHLWSKIMRRSLFDGELRFPEIRCYEDVATTPWLMLRARSYYYVPQPWIFYRVRPFSLTGLVSRTAGAFDERKNDDLARALAGFVPAMRLALPEIDKVSLTAVAHFCAKEFTKISARIIGARLGRDDWRLLRRRMNRYRGMMETTSPIRFDALLTAYLSKGRIDRWFVLGLFLLLSGRAQPDVMDRDHDDESDDHGRRRRSDAEPLQQ